MSSRPYDHLADGGEADRAEFIQRERASIPPASTLADELLNIADSISEQRADWAETVRRGAAALNVMESALCGMLDDCEHGEDPLDCLYCRKGRFIFARAALEAS